MRNGSGLRAAGHLARVNAVRDSGSGSGPTAITAVCRLALLGLVLVLVVLSYYPFTWDPPRTVRNQVTRSAAHATNTTKRPSSSLRIPSHFTGCFTK